MKKTILLFILIIILNTTIFAQSEQEIAGAKMAVSLGPEWNMNSGENFAGGLSLGFDYNLPISAAPFAVGVSVSGSNNFYNSGVIEGSGLFRWYFLNLGNSNHRFTGFFAQADLGAFFIFENDKTTPLFMGGLRGGYRLPIGPLFFVEPYGRLGYPFAFGIGAIAGVRF